MGGEAEGTAAAAAVEEVLRGGAQKKARKAPQKKQDSPATSDECVSVARVTELERALAVEKRRNEEFRDQVANRLDEIAAASAAAQARDAESLAEVATKVAHLQNDSENHAQALEDNMHGIRAERDQVRSRVARLERTVAASAAPARGWLGDLLFGGVFIQS